jgi:CRP/FNR family transcriptional regulator
MATISPLAEQVRACYPDLRGMPIDQLEKDLRTAAQLLEAGAGLRLFEEGHPCMGFPLVLDGEVCVARSSASGRTMDLYRVESGEVCVVSASCLLAKRNMSAQATAVRPTRLVMLTPAAFERWTSYAPFRAFVFSVFADRLNDLMSLVDAIAFQRLDQRLADHLLGHGQCLRTTHQALADELGTVREIITRLLNRFEVAGYLRLARERIDVIDAAGLRAIAKGETKAPR